MTIVVTFRTDWLMSVCMCMVMFSFFSLHVIAWHCICNFYCFPKRKYMKHMILFCFFDCLVFFLFLQPKHKMQPISVQLLVGLSVIFIYLFFLFVFFWVFLWVHLLFRLSPSGGLLLSDTPLPPPQTPPLQITEKANPCTDQAVSCWQ